MRTHFAAVSVFHWRKMQFACAAQKITCQVSSDVIGSEEKMPARIELEEGVMAAVLWR